MKDKLEKLKALAGRQDRMMYLVAILTEELEKQGIRPILVGGGALEFYTQGNYMTNDIDLVVDGREQAKALLEEIGFKRGLGEKSWYHEDLGLAVEMPDYFLAGSMEKITAVEVEEGLTAYLIGVEDLVIDRLNAYKYWDSLSDGEWAFVLLYIHYEDIDFEYLRAFAEKENVTGVLEKMIDKVKEQRKRKGK